MTPEECDDQWRCEWGYWHVVPSLAADCTGEVHGIVR